jgi:hypothetical protein
VFESRSGTGYVFFFTVSFIYIFIISFLLSGVQISDYFFPEVIKIQQVFESVNFIKKFQKSICS